MELLFLFLVGHAVCDFALQGEAMGRGKSRRRARREPAGDDFPPWYAWLGAHAMIHGGAVFLVSGLWTLGALEAVLHATIDHQKCEGRLSFDGDQLLHIACKAGYATLLVAA